MLHTVQSAPLTCCRKYIIGTFKSKIPSRIQPRQSCNTLFHADEDANQPASSVTPGAKQIVSAEILICGLSAMAFR